MLAFANKASLSAATLLFAALATAHMEMSQPLPIRSRLDPQVHGDLADYNLKSPLTANGSNFPCHGYQNDRPIRTTASYTPGQTYSMSIVGTVPHGGGSCQLSLSYDNGASFKVIKSMIGGCPLTTQYDFQIPSFAPTGNALFAWTWFNEIGNREMYMNCAWVNIATQPKAKRYSRMYDAVKRDSTSFTSMSSLPDIWRANIQGLSSCSTIEGQDPVFAHPGPDVTYGSGKKAGDPVTLSNLNCDAMLPLGQTYQRLDVGPIISNTITNAGSTLAATSSSTGAAQQISNAGIFAEGAASASTRATIPTSLSSSLSSTLSTSSSSILVPTNTLAGPTLTGLSSILVTSTGSLTTSASLVPAASNVTSVGLNSTEIVSFANSSSSASASLSAPTLPTGIGSGTTSLSIVVPTATRPNGNLPACSRMSSVSLTAPSVTIQGSVVLSSSSILVISTVTPSPPALSTVPTTMRTSVSSSSISTIISLPSTIAGTSTTSPISNPSLTPSSGVGVALGPYLTFATTNSTSYLPCVPGAFLCVSPTRFLICDQAASILPMTPLQRYVGPLDVAAGMSCMPFLQKFPDTETAARYADAANVKNGALPQGYFRSDRYVRAGTFEVASS